MAGEHIKHLTSNEYSPLLLPCCITGGEYRDSLKILKQQGCPKITKNFDYINTKSITTGLESKSKEEILIDVFIAIGEYFSFAGGEEGINRHLNEIFNCIIELKNRDINLCSFSI